MEMPSAKIVDHDEAPREYSEIPFPSHELEVPGKPIANGYLRVGAVDVTIWYAADRVDALTSLRTVGNCSSPKDNRDARDITNEIASAHMIADSCIGELGVLEKTAHEVTAGSTDTTTQKKDHRPMEYRFMNSPMWRSLH